MADRKRALPASRHSWLTGSELSLPAANHNSTLGLGRYLPAGTNILLGDLRKLVAVGFGAKVVGLTFICRGQFGIFLDHQTADRIAHLFRFLRLGKSRDCHCRDAEKGPSLHSLNN